MKNETSEYRKEDLIVQVKGMGKPENFAYYARETVITEKKGWSEWEVISNDKFRYIDRESMEKYGVGECENHYAEFYMDTIS